MRYPHLTERENRILQHISMWGSEGYGAFVTKLHKSRGWLVEGFPTVFQTKREATAQFERYHDLLIDKAAKRA